MHTSPTSQHTHTKKRKTVSSSERHNRLQMETEQSNGILEAEMTLSKFFSVTDNLQCAFIQWWLTLLIESTVINMNKKGEIAQRTEITRKQRHTYL